jgi:4-alpha-glucanotransferase
MTDAAVRALARRAGVAMQWSDYAGKKHRVSLEAVRRILAALGLPCATAHDVAHSRHSLDEAPLPPLVTATAGQPIDLPFRLLEGPDRGRVIREDGSIAEVSLDRSVDHVRLPGIDAVGYHQLELGNTQITLAVAPARCVTVEDLAPRKRVWGLAAQIYGLRSPGDCGIGDMAGVTALAKASAVLGADALALSPSHALFTADCSQFSPYSPSSRLFYNPLHADASALFGEARVAKARSAAGLNQTTCALGASPLIDWTRSSRAKLSLLRALFDDFSSTDLQANPATELALDFAEFRTASGAALEQHARFDTLHAVRLQADPQAWNWRDWPAHWRDPHSPAVEDFAQRQQPEVRFHAFLQWVADRSFAAAAQQAKHAGMRIGLIADLAVGMSSGGSHAWTNQDDILGGVQIGAPPDLFNRNGQNWGLTTFSPRALSRSGFASFIATLRACMRHAGGVRIDHAMGFMRLWVTPYGAEASEGAYLAYPLDDLLRLTALESHRHRAIVIGEDLGTVPTGFRERLGQAGIYGMRVLWFERNKKGFAAPTQWPENAVAMTSTHDLPTVAGWWRGVDLQLRAECSLPQDIAAEQAARTNDRRKIWSAFESAAAGHGSMPAVDAATRVADAAVQFIAKTPARLALLPLEDALALEDQPNLPATVDEHPNWRRRYRDDASKLLDHEQVRTRLAPLNKRAAP